MNAIGRESLDVLFDPFRAGRNGHFAVGAIDLGRGNAGAGKIGFAHLLDDVHLVAVDGDRHLIRFG
ncbi:hypothetical protein D3C79_1035480 [compost metagenome]